MVTEETPVHEHDPTDTRVCPSPGGCAGCPDPSYCRGLRVGIGITTTEQEYAARDVRDSA